MGTPTEPTKPNLTREQMQRPLRVSDIRGLMQAVADVVKPLQQRIEQLEQRVVPKYLGVHEPGRVYLEGSMVTDHGSCWYARRATMSRPGGSDDWTLMVKKGRDADRPPRSTTSSR
jgi:hypothetical protein